jgi:hypothetical protein
MELNINRRQCACRYAVIGTAYLCPACGNNAADQIFTQSIEGIRKTLDAIASITAAVPDSDASENTKRFVIEHGLQNTVTAFQRYAEALYSQPRKPARRPADSTPIANHACEILPCYRLRCQKR